MATAGGVTIRGVSDDRTVTRPVMAPSRAVADAARIVVVHPPELCGAARIEGPRVVLGRNPEGGATVPISHPTVSRSHLALEWEPARRGWAALDLGSHNGTAIDGAPLASGGRAPIGDGSVLRLGQVLAVFEAGKRLSAADAPGVDREAIPGDAAATCHVRAQVARAARDPSPVLVVGETGTGKELVTAELHRLSGRSGRLVAVNCAALSRELVESQLFGHAKGSFTGATDTQPGLFRAAQGGTLFLDEVGELPLDLQPKLLRAIQTGEVHAVGAAQAVRVDVRVVAATNRDLSVEVEAGRFRRDLYARLALWEVRVPPLRERRADLLCWVTRLHHRWMEGRSRRAAPWMLSSEAAEALLVCPWPDNLRGVDRLIHELGSAVADGATVALADLPTWLTEPRRADARSAEPPEPPGAPAAPKPPTPSKAELEALLAETGSVRATAKRLGRDRRQIYRWIEAHGLRKPEGE